MQAEFVMDIISIISNDGSTLKKTTYLGTSGFDAIYGIEFDKTGFPVCHGLNNRQLEDYAQRGFY